MPDGTIDVGSLLLALLFGGLLGTVGQGVRAVAGLKKMSDDAQAKGVSASTLFSPSWFFVSLFIGFIAGVIATLFLGAGKLLKVNPDNMTLMLGIAAAGYSGSDFIEAFASRISSGLLPPVGVPKAAPPTPPGNDQSRSFPA
jgi:putative chitinase